MAPELLETMTCCAGEAALPTGVVNESELIAAPEPLVTVIFPPPGTVNVTGIRCGIAFEIVLTPRKPVKVTSISPV
jgi:hypothetical protein